MLSNRSESAPGSMVVACMEGLRPVLVEMQALTVHSVLAIPRRIAAGYDYNRMIILLAVLEKRVRIPFSTDDVYLNVAGGFRVRETAADLGIALALVSVKKDIPLPGGLMALGEIGLTGEVMPVSKIGPRLKEAVKMKFNRFLLPEGNREEVTDFCKSHGLTGMLDSMVFIRHLSEALEYIR